MGSVNVSFHHSLIISICSRERHDFFDFFDGTFEASVLGPSIVESLDLHTATALIGRNDIDITIGQLGLQHDAKETDGVVGIYAVVRVAERTQSQSRGIGKDAVFRFSDRWVPHR